jgi:hypothetical protein
VADLAAGGLSLGAGAALGGAIGGAISQGLGPLGRKLFNTLRDVHELSVDDGVLLVLADWQLALVRALERRGHAATGRIEAHGTGTESAQRTLAAAVRATAPARSHSDWDRVAHRWLAAESSQREALVADVAVRLLPALKDERDL